MSTFNGAITRVKKGRKCGRVKEGRKGGGGVTRLKWGSVDGSAPWRER
jgi:hypothetical protein